MNGLAAVLAIVQLAVGWQHGPPDAGAGAPPPDPFAQNACVRCHENLAGRLGEIALLEWKNSVHRENSVGCDGCHGGDASVRAEQFRTPDEFKQAAHLALDTKFMVATVTPGQFVGHVRGREVSYFCGKCHALIKEKHLGSPHGDFGDPSCLYCHARTPEGRFTHRITAANLDIIDTRPKDEGGRCAVCHKATTMDIVAQIKSTLAESADRIEQTSQLNEQLIEMGYRSLELKELQEHGREVQSRLRRVFHSFDMREIGDFSGEIKALAERTTRTHDLLTQLVQTRRRQTVTGLAVCTFLIAFAGLLLYYDRAFLRHDHGAAPAAGESAGPRFAGRDAPASGTSAPPGA